MARYYDIHTHLYRPSTTAEVSIYALGIGASTEEPKKGWFSTAIHPYHLNPGSGFNASWIDRLAEIAKSPRCVAIGETGLDLRAEYQTSVKQQIATLDEHIFIAKKLNKPLIIHAVRALPQILQRVQNTPFIIHGFVGSIEDFEKIVEAGGVISLGEKLLKNPQLKERAILFNPQKVLLETDDAPTPIEQIYQEWAKIQALDLEQTKEIVERNVEKLFGKL